MDSQRRMSVTSGGIRSAGWERAEAEGQIAERRS